MIQRLTSLLRSLRTLWRGLMRGVRALLRGVLRALGVILLAAILGDGRIVDDSLRGRATAIVRAHLFDYVAWEVDALWAKVRQEVLGVGPYLEDAAGRAVVTRYLERLTAVQQLEAQIEGIYADPAARDPAAASADLRAQRDTLRRDLARDQALAEQVIEAQVSAVLVDEGFGLLGQVLPPVSMHMTDVPAVLVISPRDRIAFAAQIELNPLPVEQRAALEAQLDAALEVSSLIVPLGGLSLYPSMIVEPSAREIDAKIARAIEVTAHEWAHHYLMFFPLGWEYARPETRIINETTATFFGRAVASEVMRRFYPDLRAPVYPSFLTPKAPPVAQAVTPHPTDPDAPEPFDYAREMNATRVQVDFLLWQGLVAGAERYLQFQQRHFARNGYPIRKLNQAYFAFYGGYQGSPGAGGADPTGPAIEALLARSATLEDFLQTLRGITRRADLLAVAS